MFWTIEEKAWVVSSSLIASPVEIRRSIVSRHRHSSGAPIQLILFVRLANLSRSFKRVAQSTVRTGHQATHRETTWTSIQKPPLLSTWHRDDANVKKSLYGFSRTGSRLFSQLRLGRFVWSFLGPSSGLSGFLGPLEVSEAFGSYSYFLILGVDLVRSRPGSGWVFSAILQFVYVFNEPCKREFSSEN